MKDAGEISPSDGMRTEISISLKGPQVGLMIREILVEIVIPTET